MLTNILTICVRSYIFLVITIFVLIVVLVTGIRFAKPLAKIMLWAMGIDLEVYGNVDPSASVVVFNHPHIYDAVTLNAAVGPVSGLIMDFNWLSKVYAYLLDCVLVKESGGQDTTRRMKEKVASSKVRYCIAIHRHTDKGVGGKICGDTIETCKTIGFRCSDCVQPVVIVIDKNAIEKKAFYPTIPLDNVGKIRVYVMPTMKRKPDEDPAQFAYRTQMVMNRCLKLAWSKPTVSTPKSKACSYTALCFTSMVFHAMIKGHMMYGLSWLILTVTSLLYHTVGGKTLRYIDKIAVYTAVSFGLYHYMNCKNKSWIPVITFISVLLLYFVFKSVDHTWVHALSLLGHHAIMFSV